MSDILCVYYSRTGHTKQAMEEIAQALDAELAEISDGMDRSGALGVLRSGLDAVRRSSPKVKFKDHAPDQILSAPAAPGELPAGDRGVPHLGGAVQLRGPGIFEAVREDDLQRRLCGDPGQRGPERGRL